MSIDIKMLAVFLLIGSLFIPDVYANNEKIPYQVPSTPTSPQAEAFKLYGNVAVNPSTGVPDISIPLFEIEHHGYRLPLSLRYTPAPMKPGYNYDVFGRGWALSVSSCISRSIESMPDERSYFALELDKLDYTYDPLQGIPDGFNLKPDKFSALLPDGSSFDFFIRENYQGKIDFIISGDRKVKISYTIVSRDIIAFKVVDEQGIEYVFSAGDMTYTGRGAPLTPYGSAYVSWQLTSIRLPHTSNTITFSYGNSIQSDFGRQMQEQAVRFHHNFISGFSPDDFDLYTYTVTQQCAYQMQLLTFIGYGDTQISIDYVDGEDKERFNYAKRIRISDGGKLLRSVELKQHQSEVWSSVVASGMMCSTLDSVTIVGNDGQTSETYACEYEGSGFSFSGTDHWGYLNTVGSRSVGVANMNLFMEFDVSRASGGGFVRDASRSSADVSPFDKVKITTASHNFRDAASAASHCILKRLVYPTGGYTEFVFENHKFWSHTDYTGDYIPDKKRRRVTDAAGFRIREIADYTADHQCSGKRRYYYGEKIDNMWLVYSGAGEPTVDPNIETYMSFEASSGIPMFLPFMVKGLDPQGKHRAFDNVFKPDAGYLAEWEFACTFSAQNFRRLLNGRQPVVYPEVAVHYSKSKDGDQYPANCEGMTLYKYDIYEPGYMDTLFFEYPQYMGQLQYYDPQPYRYGLLKERLDYKSDGQGYKLIRKENQTWTYWGATAIGYDYSNPYGTSRFTPSNTPISYLFTSTWDQIGAARLENKEIVHYDDEGNTFCEKEEYSYAYAGALSRKLRTVGGKEREWIWERPKIAVNAETDTIVKQLVDRNILSVILKDHQVDYECRRCEYGEYEVSNGRKLLLPARLYDGNYQGFFHKEFLSYTCNGNPIEQFTKEGLHTVYLWGYGDRYMVAEIQNATLPEVEAAVAEVFGMTVEELAEVSVPDAKKLRALRNHPSLKAAHVSVFTHQPLVGVTSITDPTGKTVCYGYDPLGRLKETYYYEGEEKRLIQEYEYHFANQ